MCGEKSMYDYGNNTAQGSPPRMRGKVVLAMISSLLCEDHPRVCGEKIRQSIWYSTT